MDITRVSFNGSNLFDTQLVMKRTYVFSKSENVVKITDDIENICVLEAPCMLLYHFIEWKMMGENEYVLGLEPANCTVDGRDETRKQGILKFIKPGDTYNTSIEIRFTEAESDIFPLEN